MPVLLEKCEKSDKQIIFYFLSLVELIVKRVFFFRCFVLHIYTCRMPRGRGSSVTTHEKPKVDEAVSANEDYGRRRRTPFLLLGLLMVFLHGSWSVYRFQFANLPLPLDAEQAGKRGFSEASALEHVKYLAALGPHPVGSDSIDLAVQVVLYSYKFQATCFYIISYQTYNFIVFTKYFSILHGYPLMYRHLTFLWSWNQVLAIELILVVLLFAKK